MSHIAFELDALPLVPKVARSAGIQEAVVGWGLTQMWEWCWREKTDKVTTNHLRGFFGTELGAILVDFGFLEAIGASLWRVRGATRYLRIQEGRERGGRTSKGNLRQYQKAPAEAPADLRLATGSPPADLRLTSRLTTGLSATSDERLATSDERTTAPAKKPREAKPADPRLGPLIGRLKASFAELVGTPYDFSEADGGALKNLMKRADDAEIDRRFRIGLNADQYSTKCATVLQLAQRWNELAVQRGTAPARARDEETIFQEGRVT